MITTAVFASERRTKEKGGQSVKIPHLLHCRGEENKLFGLTHSGEQIPYCIIYIYTRYTIYPKMLVFSLDLIRYFANFANWQSLP